MRHFNIRTICAGIILTIQALLLQACGTDVGGDEDRTPPVVSIDAVTDANDTDGEIIGEATIHWTTDEPNPSTVDIFLSSNSGESYDTTIVLDTPDTGTYAWDTNSVPDCRACRLRIIARDVVGNVSEPADSSEDFIINNVPQVLGSAFYTDMNNDGPGDGDSIRVPFDKDLELLTSIASDIFFFPVLGDNIGPFATVEKSATTPNELVITFNDLVKSNFHLRVREQFDQENLYLTAPSGMNLRDNLALGILFAKDTGQTAAPAENGIDIAPAFLEVDALSDSDATYSVALGDVDGDGAPDLVIGNSTHANVLWLNDGTGAFPVARSLVPPFPLGSGDTRSVALGDVNGDGHLDFVVGNYGANEVWLNDGSGELFVPPMSFLGLGSSDTNSVVLGDVNGDGHLDFVAGNNGENRVWLNNGSGGFTSLLPTLGNSDTTSLALDDIDGDGDLDLIEGARDLSDNAEPPTRVWLNDGSGVFTESQQMLGNNAGSVALGDVDNDGDLDLIEGGGSTASEPIIRIWLNGGGGVFTESQQLLGNSVGSLALGDVDGDGDLDLVAANALSDPNRVWWNNGSGGFTDTPPQELPGYRTQSVALGDIDGDGDLDLVTGNGTQFAPLQNRVWKNSSRSPMTPLFIDSVQALGNNVTKCIALGDVDGDDDLDLIEGNGAISFFELEPTPNRVWLNDGSGVFTVTVQELGGSYTTSVALGDVDGDDDLDFITGNTSLSTGLPNRVWLNDGSGGFFPGAPIGDSLSNNNFTYSIALGDVDGDGHLDFVAGNIGENRVWLNDGSGGFFPGAPIGDDLTNNESTFSVALDDLDGDDDLDFIAGNSGGNRVWLNDGSGVFTDSGQTPLGDSGTSSVVIDDVDGDGDLDFVAGNNGGNRVWLNNIYNSPTQQGVFTQAGPELGDSITASVRLGDVDSDGDLDFVAGNSGENRVWLNDY